MDLEPLLCWKHGGFKDVLSESRKMLFDILSSIVKEDSFNRISFSVHFFSRSYAAPSPLGLRGESSDSSASKCSEARKPYSAVL